MPKVNVKHISQLSPEECFDKIEKLFEKDQDIRKLDANFSCNFDRDKLCGNAKSKQFKADLKVEEHDDGASVDLVISLPMHLALAKGMVKTMLTKKLEKYVG